MSRSVRTIRDLLLAFVLVSVGFEVGREVTLRRLRETPATTLTGGPGHRVVAYYMHGTYRCTACNTIERLAREVIETRFADRLAAGDIRWQTVDFMVREDLAERYDVSASCLVLVSIRDGQEIAFEVLEEVWELSEDPPAFNAYVEGAIGRFLNWTPAPAVLPESPGS